MPPARGRPGTTPGRDRSAGSVGWPSPAWPAGPPTRSRAAIVSTPPKGPIAELLCLFPKGSHQRIRSTCCSTSMATPRPGGSVRRTAAAHVHADTGDQESRTDERQQGPGRRPRSDRATWTAAANARPSNPRAGRPAASIRRHQRGRLHFRCARGGVTEPRSVLERSAIPCSTPVSAHRLHGRSRRPWTPSRQAQSSWLSRCTRIRLVDPVWFGGAPATITTVSPGW